MIIRSKYHPFLTLDYIVNEPENKLFDRKSYRVKAADLAPIISAFANDGILDNIKNTLAVSHQTSDISAAKLQRISEVSSLDEVKSIRDFII